jgi:peptide/nickel transport system substrate-binding protein
LGNLHQDFLCIKSETVDNENNDKENIMKLNRVLFLILLVGLMVFAAGCGGSDQANNTDTQTNAGDDTADNDTMNNDTTEDQSADEDMHAMAISGDLVLDPAQIASDDVSSLIICDYLYDSLVTLDGGSIGAGIALSWDESDDGLAYEFQLRTDAVFTDGSPVTADVVLDNFNRWFDPEHPLHGADSSVYQAWLQYFAGFLGELDADDKPISLFDGIEKVDNRTVLIHLNEPMPEFLETIAMPFFSILNPTALENGDYGMTASSVDGTGAYLVGEWTDTGLTLVPNNDFWGDTPADDLQFIFE